METTAKIKLPRRHSAQAQVYKERKRRNVLCCGRRWGKNIFLQSLAAKIWFHSRYKFHGLADKSIFTHAVAS